MAAQEIPGGPEQLTAEWLTEALRETGTIRTAGVQSFDMEPDIAAGTGFLGVLARVRPHYDPPEEGAPQSLIAKFPTPTPENREIAEAFRFYEIETRFYEEIADAIELRTPRRYYSALDSRSGDFVLLLEDLAPARVGDQVAGCSMQQAELAIRELAKFHATWWQHPRLAELDWLPFINDPVRAQSVQDNYQEAWGPFVQQFGNQVSPSILETGERLGKNIITMIDQLAQEPQTIVHGDYRLDNLFFATPEGGDPFAVIDWQICSRGRGVFDVAYFTAGTLPPADRKTKELELLRMYHDILSQNGVKGYDFDQCLYDYRASVLFLLVYSVIAMGALDMTNERGVELFTTILKRTAAAITDLNADELLPD